MLNDASFDGTPFSSFWLKPRCSDLRGASRFDPNGLKLEKETTHDLV